MKTVKFEIKLKKCLSFFLNPNISNSCLKVPSVDSETLKPFRSAQRLRGDNNMLQVSSKNATS